MATLVFGILLLALAFRLRSMRDEIPLATSAWPSQGVAHSMRREPA